MRHNGLSPCWRAVPDRAKQASMVDSVDPAEGGHFHIRHVAPRALAIDQFGFVETVDRVSEGVEAVRASIAKSMQDTNRLSHHYFPKGTGLSQHHQDELEAVLSWQTVKPVISRFDVIYVDAALDQVLYV